MPDLGSVEISKITPRQVQELQSKLLRDGMAPKGVEMVHGVFSGAMKHALKVELIFRNPVEAVSPPPCRRPKPSALPSSRYKLCFAWLLRLGTTSGPAFI